MKAFLPAACILIIWLKTSNCIRKCNMVSLNSEPSVMPVPGRLGYQPSSRSPWEVMKWTHSISYWADGSITETVNIHIPFSRQDAGTKGWVVTYTKGIEGQALCVGSAGKGSRCCCYGVAEQLIKSSFQFQGEFLYQFS